MTPIFFLKNINNKVSSFYSNFFFHHRLNRLKKLFCLKRASALRCNATNAFLTKKLRRHRRLYAHRDCACFVCFANEAAKQAMLASLRSMLRMLRMRSMLRMLRMRSMRSMLCMLRIQSMLHMLPRDTVPSDKKQINDKKSLVCFLTEGPKKSCNFQPI